MKHVRALHAGVPPQILAIVMVMSVLLTVSAISSATSELAQAATCSSEWSAAIEARENGAESYRGECVDFGGFTAGDGVPEEFRQNARTSQQRFDTLEAEMQERTWSLVSGNLGTFALIVVAILTGGLIPGSLLGSGTAAWALSNGWSRRTLGASVVAYVLGLSAALFFVMLIAGVIGVSIRLTTLGGTAHISSPVPASLLPLGGMLFYAAVATLVSFAAGRAEVGAIAAVGVTGSEFVLASFLGGPPVFMPSGLYQRSLNGVELIGSTEATVSALTLAVVGLAIAWLTARWCERTLTYPDRAA